MATKVRVEHDGKAWIDIFKSDGMRQAVDMAGEAIARNANAAHPGGHEHFGYQGRMGNFTYGGFVTSMDFAGASYQAKDDTLTKAVRP